MKLNLSNRWVIFGIAFIISVAIVLAIVGGLGYFKKTSSPPAAPTPGNYNLPDGPLMATASSAYNYSTKQVDVTYTIDVRTPPVNQPDGYKVFLQQFNPFNPPEFPVYPLIETIPFQNIPKIVVTRSYPASRFSNSICSNDAFVIWGYKGDVYSSGASGSGNIIPLFSDGFSNLSETKASYAGTTNGLGSLKIEKSSYSEFPCWAYIGELYGVGYATRTSLDGKNWSSPDFGGYFPSDLSKNVNFVPASETQTSYVQIAAFSTNQNTTISPWSSTITVTASSS